MQVNGEAFQNSDRYIDIQVKNWKDVKNLSYIEEEQKIINLAVRPCILH